MKDFRVIPDVEGSVAFDVYGKTEDTALALLQRLYVLMLSSAEDEYRSMDGPSLMDMISGNILPDNAMNSILAIACSNALHALDEDDQSDIASFTGICTDGVITCSLTLTDGTSITKQGI